MTPFDTEGMKRELEIMATESGAELLYHAKIVSADVKEGKAESLTVSSMGYLIRIKAKVFVDSTGDAILLRLAGVDLTERTAFDAAMKEFSSVLDEFEKTML